MADWDLDTFGVLFVQPITAESRHTDDGHGRD